MAGMSEERKRADGMVVAIAIAALVLVSLALYAGGYFALSNSYTVDAVVHVRAFNSEWQAIIYRPAGKVERLLTGKNVVVIGPVVTYPTPLPDSGIAPPGH